MARLEVVTAEERHAESIAAHLREADRREIWAFGRKTPLEAALDSYRQAAACWVGLVDGEAAFMFGVAGASPALGIVGLLGTDLLERVGLAFARRSRFYVEAMLDLYPQLTNFVHAENAVSLRWLEWCGFEIERRPVRVNGEPFYKFWRCRDV